MVQRNEEDAQKKRARKAQREQRHAPVIELAKTGATLQAIADRLGVSKERVRQILAKNDLNIKDFRAPLKRKPTPEETMEQRRRAILGRFLSKVSTTDEALCWNWIGRTWAPNPKYPEYRIPRMIAHDPIETGRSRITAAYRVAYMLLVGDIPKGMQVHRTCYNRLCCNPKHLELLTLQELGRRKNPALLERARARRKTECLRGHPLDGANLYVAPGGQRACRTCARERARRKAEKIRAAR